MRPSAASQLRCFRRSNVSSSLSQVPVGRRFVNISSAPASSHPNVNSELSNTPSSNPVPTPDARFEIIGTPFSLLSVSLSASQNLYTRRGTLVSVSGKAENAISTLSLLEPIRRTALGIPFLYQRITSTSPLTALISSKSPISSMVVVHLDGRQDWIVAQRNALLAWTGHSLTLKPRLNAKLSLAHWGNTLVTGRGLLALVGKGQVYQVRVKPGESYVAHPSNVVAYIATATPPQPYRFKSSTLRFQVPNIGFTSYLHQNIKFFRVMSETKTWRTIAGLWHALLTWSRRSIWGDRLFLKFEGPSTLLIQSRASRPSDVLTMQDVEEIASTPPGAVNDVIKAESRKEMGHGSASSTTQKAETAQLRYASVGKDGKVEIAEK